MREELVDIGESVKPTIRQRVLDVAGFKLERQGVQNTVVSSEKVSKLYNANVVLARSTEPVSVAFVDSSMTIYKRILMDPVKALILALCDDLYPDPAKHPFNSIYVLQAICDRASTPAKILTALIWLVDHYRMEIIDIGCFACRRMKDPKESYVNVCTLKSDVKTFMTGEWLDGLDILPDAKQKCRSVFASVDTVRSEFSPYPGTTVDTTFMAGWPQSCTMTFQFVDDLCFSGLFDGRYRDARKSCLEVADFMAYSSVQERITEITDQIKSEKLVEVAPTTSTTPTSCTATSGTPVAATAVTPPSTTVAETPEPAEGFGSLDDVSQEMWLKAMRKLLYSTIKLITDNGSKNDLIGQIRSSPLAMVKTDPTGWCSRYGL